MNVLRHSGIVAGAVDRQPTQWLDMPSGDCFAFAEDDGMVETMMDLGEPVTEGEVIARIHAIDRIGKEPQLVRAKMSGILAARHFTGLVKAGDCVAVTALLISVDGR